MRTRPAVAMLLALGIGWSGGCFSSPSGRTTTLFKSLRQGSPPAEEDVVQLDVGLIDRPPGDRYINGELWDLADEQVLPFEKKAALEDNGLRVGLVGGMPPAGLQALLTSERSCADPRRLRIHVGKSMPLVLGPTSSQCKFELHEQGRSTSVKLDQAQCQLAIEAGLAENGKTTVYFTPQITHGTSILAPRPTQDPSGTRRWELLAQQPTEKYQKLGWQMSLAANEYLIVGARLDRPETIGQRCFISEGNKPLQRLLVLRAFRAEPASQPPAGPLGKAPPLALQAAMATVRGVAVK